MKVEEPSEFKMSLPSECHYHQNVITIRMSLPSEFKMSLPSECHYHQNLKCHCEINFEIESIIETQF